MRLAIAFAGAVLLAVLAGPAGGIAPEMVEVEAGGKTLLVARYETSVADWGDCVEAGGCGYQPKFAAGQRTGDYPVTGLGFNDVQQYVAWINSRTGRNYRLPSNDEWNAIAATLARPQRKKLFEDPRLSWAADYGSMPKVSRGVLPLGAFGALANGVSDLGGNVWEWTSTCAVADRTDEDCPAYFVQGLHEAAVSIFVRDTSAGGCASGEPPANLGFRLVLSK